MEESTRYNFSLLFFLLLIISILFPVRLPAQAEEIPLHREKYELNSGYYIGDQSGDKLVYTAVINSPGVPWLNIHFGSYNLGKNSYLIITSLYDGKWQRQDNITLAQWYNFSAFFNGDAVKIELYAASGDENIFFIIDELVIGDMYAGTESICGPTDDRIPSSDPAVGRIIDIGCTGWIIPDGDIVTAGHCLDATNADVLEFNVPLSLPNGTIQHPGPEDQYSIDQSSRIFINGGIGNDFGVCKVFPNSVTGLMPKQAQQAYFTLVQDLSSDPIRITGYGVDDGTANQTQQTNSGPNAGSSGTTMRYVVDTQGGNSGSPVIDDNTHFAVGVHTHGGCTASGGNNNGTSLFHAAFWEAVQHGAGGCGVDPAADPVPANSSVNVSVDLAELSWTNGGGAVTNELYFGTDPGSLTLVQSGSLSSGWTITSGPLSYMTTYFWQVVEIGDTCSTPGTVWSFTTEQNPSVITLYLDDFESGLGNYTVNTTGGCPWQIFTDPAITGRYTLPATAGGGILAADADHCGSSGGGSSGEVILNDPIDASQYQSVAVEWDNDWQAIGTSDFAYLDVSTDGGSTWMNVITFDVNDVRNTHEYYDISSMVAMHSFILRLVSVQPGWDWWWAIDNLQVTGWDMIPVELSSFNAVVSEGNVVLNWTTATETNNKGFEVQRSSSGEFSTIAFVQGNGTSTQQHSYTFSDGDVADGKYSYRLKQVDFSGSSEYSKVVEIDVKIPVEFGLAQNYPNPFNPSTKINFSLAVDSKVTLKVFDVLGQEVALLVNKQIAAGRLEITFNASRLNSGVYLYRLEASGIDGRKYTSVKKMILAK
jgi:V8-like Glu-specific endopeptidase